MKKDKRLQQLADASLENFEDKAFKQELLQRQSTVKPKKLSGRTVAWLSSAACAVVAIVVTAVLLSVYLRPEQDNTVYLLGQLVASDAQISDVNEITVGMDFADLDYEILKKYIDDNSGKSVYFNGIIVDKEAFYQFNIVVVVDQRYKYSSENSFSLDVLTDVAEVKGYTVNYLPTSVQNDMLYFHTVRGVITTETEKVYVQFEQTTIGESNDFLELLAQLIV